MKLQGISYNRVGTPGLQNVGQAVQEAGQKQQIAGAVMNLAGTVANAKVEYDAVRANADYRDGALELQKALSGRDQLTRKDLTDIGVSEANPDIPWTDEDGARDTFKKYEVEPAVLSEVLESRAVEYSKKIASRPMRAKWLSHARDSNSKMVEQSLVKSARDQADFEYRSDVASVAERLDAGMYEGAREIVQNSPSFANKPDLQQEYISEINEAQLVSHSEDIAAFGDEAIRAAREGNTTLVNNALTGHNEFINRLESQGLIANPETARTMKEDMVKMVVVEQARTDIRRRVQSGDGMGALDDLMAFRETALEGFTVEEQEELYTTLVSDVSSNLTMRNKAETADDDNRKNYQGENSSSLYLGILGGEADATNVAAALRRGEIDQTQAEKLVNLVQTRGQGVDDWTLVNSLRAELRAGEDIRPALTDNAGDRLTNETAMGLMDDYYKYQDEESPLRTNDADRYRQHVIRSIRVTGPMGALDTEAERRMSQSVVDYDNDILKGMAPARAAEKYINRDKLNRFYLPSVYGSKNDLTGALNKLGEMVDDKTIDGDEYNRQVTRIREYEEALSNQEQFEADLNAEQR